MKLDRQRLARTATAKALQIRKRIGSQLWEPICVYDLADRLGVDVRFIDIASMEGAYCFAGHPTIIISSLRPPGPSALTETNPRVLSKSDPASAHRFVRWVRNC